MSPQNKVPVIRFEGFNGKWEEKALAQYAKFRRGSFPQPYGNKEWYDGQGAMPFVQVVDVTKKLALVKDTKQKISAIAQPKSVFVEKGKVLVTLQGSIGRVAIAQYNTYVDRTLLIFETFEKKTDSHYWAYLIQNKFDIEKRKAPGGTIKTITKEALSVFLVHIPEYKEQTKIGNYFQQIDTLIAQHEQKHDKLLNLKKALLEKMFSRQDATKPEIRFKGFKEEWFQEKVLNIAPLQRGFDLPKSAMKIGTYPVVMSNGINGYHIKFKAKAPGIVTGRSGTIGNIHYIEDDYWPHNTALWVTNCKGNLPRFIYYLYIKLNLKRFGTGSGVPTLNRNDVHEQYISLPKETEEQTKISQLFKNLDTLIAQHRAQLKKLRNIKQACLDKMFV